MDLHARASHIFIHPTNECVHRVEVLLSDRDVEKHDFLSLLQNYPKRIYEDGGAYDPSRCPAKHETGYARSHNLV